MTMNRNLGLVRVCAVSPEVKPADVYYNLEKIKNAINDHDINNIDLILFPELSLTGYTCADLFYQTNLLETAEKALISLARYSSGIPACMVVGIPLLFKNKLFNCGAVIYDGSILGIVPKTHIPNYNEFYEKRWFSSSNDIEGKVQDMIHIGEFEVPFGTDILFDINGVMYGVEICEDLWVPVPPSSNMTMAGADIILNLSASNEQVGKNQYLLDLIKLQSAKCRCGYVYSSAGTGESSTDLVFSGNCIIAENGNIISNAPRFELGCKSATADIDIEAIRKDRIKFSTFNDDARCSEYRIVSIRNDDKRCNILDSPKSVLRRISPFPFTDGSKDSLALRCREISDIQVWGLAHRMRSINCKNAIIGISGGLDSTLALLVTVAAFDKLGIDRKGIKAVTMPGFGTTARTHGNAGRLMDLLGVTSIEIPIGNAVCQHFKDIGHSPEILDATYENSQARERTQILMDLANKYNGIVIGTGDLSELALGWCTYNGDHMSMYGVNSSVPKTLVKFLVEGYAESTDNSEIRKVLLDIINTPISPELLPASDNDDIIQKTEDLVGPYELHDFFIYYMLRFSFSPRKIYKLAQIAFKDIYQPDIIKKWLRVFYQRFFSQQFKRSCMPDGVKVGSVCLSPRGDWRMPSDASSRLWLEEVDKL